MNKIMRLGLTALLAWGFLTACSDFESDETAEAMNALSSQYAVYDGEWTMNKQVVDTARLEVTNVLKVRLPEKYLGTSCFGDEYTDDDHTLSIGEYKGQPISIPYRYEGYSANALFSTIASTEKSFHGVMLFNNVSFTVAIDGVDHRVDLLSGEPGNAVYRNDNDQWTIGLTVTSFYVTNLETREEQARTLNTPIVLYYNTKNRIR